MNKHVQILLDGKGTIPIKEKYRWRQSWRFPRYVEEWFKEFCSHGHSLNVCCGRSNIGDVRIDLDPNSTATIISPYHKLPLEDCTFDRVMSDPPWYIPFFHRMWPFYELVRVCKVGGLVAYNATWIPASKSVALMDTYVRQDTDFGIASIVSVFQKYTSRFDKKSGGLTFEEVCPIDELQETLS